ncbi:MAG: isochorismatase family cysteine hydrolase [Oscillospiraceae bacterium]
MKKLLLVIDMQNDFISGTLGTKEAILIVPKVIEKIVSFDGDIIYTKDTHTADYKKTQEGKILPVQHCVKGTDGWRLESTIEKLFLEKGCEGVEKVTFGAKNLPEIIQNKYPDGLEEIELVGLCTDICVISNALLLKAFFPETRIVVDSGCCAGVMPASHQNALEAMKMCHIIVN